MNIGLINNQCLIVKEELMLKAQNWIEIKI